jgi:hypothetical protein
VHNSLLERYESVKRVRCRGHWMDEKGGGL